MTSRLPLRFPVSARTYASQSCARRSRSSSPETRSPQISTRSPSPTRAKKSALHRLSVVLLGAFSLFCAAQLSSAEARTVKIVEAQTLELRNVDVAGLDGKLETQEFIVIAGARVELRLDASTVVATRVEFNKTRRTLTLVGKGKYINVTTDKNGVSSTQTLEGDNLVVDLSSEGVEGADVLVSTAQLDVIGGEIQRIPGQIRVQGGYFTPCGKCGETPNDYAFRARELIIYPGDRLVAYDAQILLADEPVFFLPVMVFWLGDKQHQPRLEIGRDDTDGYTALLDLPYVLGDASYGFSKLRFYQNRDPFLGFGADHTSLDLLGRLFGGTDSLKFQVLLTPLPLTLTKNGTKTPEFTGDFLGRYLYDYNLDWNGTLNLLSASGLKFGLNIKRVDSDGKGGFNTNPFTSELTTTDFNVSSTLPDLSVALRYNDQYDHGPRNNQSSTLLEPVPSKLNRPELELDFNPWQKPFGIEGFSVDAKTTFGLYTGRVNPANPSARAEAKGSDRSVEAGRFEANYNLRYNTALWSDASFELSNVYTGRFYTSQNPLQVTTSTSAPPENDELARLERNVNVTFGASVTQRLGTVGSLSTRYDFSRQEGESPFLFDAPGAARSNKTLTASLDLQPQPWFSVRANQVVNLDEQKPDLQNNAQFSAGLNLGLLVPELPLTLSGTLERNFFKAEFPGTLERWTASANYLRYGLSAGLNTGWTAANPNQVGVGQVAKNRFDPLVVRAGYTDLGGAGSIEGTVSRDLNLDTPTQGTFSFSGIQVGAPLESRLRVEARENFDFQNTSVNGIQALSLGNNRLELSHNFKLDDGVVEAEDDKLENKGNLNLNFTATQGQGQGGNSSLTLGYGGPYDLNRGDWTTPLFTASYSRLDGVQSLGANVTFKAKGLDQPDWELSSASLSGNLVLVTDRVAFQGNLNYYRTRQSDSTYETLSFKPLSLTFALGSGPRPGAYLTTELVQDFILQKGGVVLEPQPLRPVIRLVIDRCCWALRSEIDLKNGSFKIGLSLPDGKERALFEVGLDKTSDPNFPIIDNLQGKTK